MNRTDTTMAAVKWGKGMLLQAATALGSYLHRALTGGAQNEQWISRIERPAFPPRFA